MSSRRKKDGQAEMRGGREATQRGADAKSAAVAFLRTLTPPELAQLLRRVFADNPPSHGQVDSDRSILFLGHASSSRVSPPGEPWEWGAWHIGAVAYHVSEHDRSGLGAPLHNETICPDCRVRLCSNDSFMVCPVCGWDCLAAINKARPARG